MLVIKNKNSRGAAVQVDALWDRDDEIQIKIFRPNMMSVESFLTVQEACELRDHLIHTLGKVDA